MGREYGPAIDMFVDENRVFTGALKNNKDISIVIHGSGSPGDNLPTGQEVALYFASNKDEVASHFIIDRAGNVFQTVSLNDGAAANCCTEPGYDTYWTPYVTKYGNLNKCTISIEHVNNGDNSLALTAKQRAASFTLVGWLCQKYDIPTTRIKTHASIDPQSRKLCPGNYPMTDLIKAVTDGQKPKIISDAEVVNDLQKAEQELVDVENQLQQLRGMLTVTKPTVIE